MRVLAPKSQWDLEHGKRVSCMLPLAGTTALLEILRPYDFVEIEMTRILHSILELNSIYLLVPRFFWKMTISRLYHYR